MSSRGFEFVGMLDGSNATPVIRDFVLGVAAAHHIGDLVLIQSDDGAVNQVTTTTAEVTGVIQEEVAAADISANTTKAKVAIITGAQLWRCSMDGVTSVKVGVKTVDTADCNTISATDVTGGRIILVNTDNLDDDGNTFAEVMFGFTTFGSAAA